MSATFPTVQHVYQNHTLDSTRWHSFTPREGDVVVATPYKCGTTWMQTIVLHLIFQDLQPHSIDEFSLWLDLRPVPLEAAIQMLEGMQYRRVIKSHVPLDGLRYFPQAKYIVVGRDARDVFMSMWNHYSMFKPDTYGWLNEFPGRIGDPFPTPPQDIRDFWRDWITRGWFEWESEGYPFWSNLHHVQSWWDYRHLPNILLVHYNDLLRDLPGEIRRIADYLNIDVSADMVAGIAGLVTFDTMKANAEKILPGAENVWFGGAQTFMNKGTNGRWRDVLTEDDITLYHAAVARELTPDCAEWLENGRLA
jgi:aryl sulfotransferase